MRFSLPGRSRGPQPANPRPANAVEAGTAKPAPTRRKRLLRTLLLVGVFAVLTWPGRTLLRAVARWLDGHAERFTEPQSITYSRFIAPLLGGLYRRATEDAAARLKGHDRHRRATVVDIGCGTGELALAISRKLRDARIVGVDNSDSMILWAARHETTDGRIRFILGDGARLPLPDASVDLVISTLSLHHWADPAGVLAEIDRVLVTGGSAFIYDMGLLTLGTRAMARVAKQAGLPDESVTLERLHGGPTTRLFVRYRYDRVD
jgi:SAM-dependent methyltransferase